MTWLWLTLLLSFIDWIMAYRRNSRIRPFTRPAPWIAMLAWILTVEDTVRLPMLLLSVGLILMLSGDLIAMARPTQLRSSFFLFSVGMVPFILLLNTARPPVNFSSFLFAVFVIFTFYRITRRTLEGFEEKEIKKLITPALAYLVISAVLVLSGLITLAKETWSPGASLAVAAGTLLISISNILNAWHHAVEPLRNEEVLKKIPLHLGYILVIAGVLTQYN